MRIEEVNERLHEGGVYRHFKSENMKYRVLGVSFPTWWEKLPSIDFMALITTDNEEMLECVLTNDTWRFEHDNELSNETYVIYQALYGEGKVYAREVNEWLSHVPLGRVSVNKYFRFEQVGE